MLTKIFSASLNCACLLTGFALYCVSLVFELACGVAFSPAPGYSRERTSPNERPDESKRHTLSGPPTRNYSSDEKVDEHSFSVNTTPEEVSRSERIKEVEAEKERKSKVREIFDYKRFNYYWKCSPRVEKLQQISNFILKINY